MTTENRRKEEYEAKTEDSGQNLAQPTNSAMVDKAEREESILPDNVLGHSDHEPPYTVPYVRWCERTGALKLPPTRFYDRSTPGLWRSLRCGSYLNSSPKGGPRPPSYLITKRGVPGICASLDSTLLTLFGMIQPLS